MFGNMRHKLKYEAVKHEGEDHHEDYEDEFDKPQVFLSRACIWSTIFTTLLITTYYIPSICLTFYQRWLFQTFHYPLMTVIVHMTVKYLLAALIRTILTKRLGKQRVLFGWKEYIIAVAPMGIFSGLDIGLSNWGLELIQISLYTMTKSTTIVFILGFSILLKLEKKSWSLCSIVIMISLGLFLFTYKTTQFNLLGFILLIIASMSSGIRWTCVQLLLQKSKMGMRNPIDMIYHMQPWMILSVLPFALWFEGPTIIKNCQFFRTTDSSLLFNTTFQVLLGAFIAFFMEVTEVLVVSYTSSLTLAIAGIIKEVFVLVLAVVFNGDRLSPINVVGLLICLSGISIHVIHKLRTNQIRQPGKIIYHVESLDRHESGEQLISGVYEPSSDSDNDISDNTQVLFSILNSRDR